MRKGGEEEGNNENERHRKVKLLQNSPPMWLGS